LRLAPLLALAVLLMPRPALAAQFREEAVSVSIPSGKLAGTLMLPDGAGPFPVALIIAGSGPTDRNGNSPPLVTVSAYQKLAQGLAARGIATLRYDKRSIGASAVTQPESDVRFDDFVDDALALTALLERDNRFTSVAIIGHSEGSLIGIVAAERDPRVSALVSLEGAGRNLATIIDEQIQQNPNNPPALVNEVKAINASLLGGKTVSNVDPLLAAMYRPSVQPFVISEFRYDPAREIAKLTIPVLIVHGSTDVQVSAKDAQALEAADPSARVLNVPGMNHVLIDAPADWKANISTYSNADAPLSAPLVPGIAGFLLAPTAK